jgi:hypothetical protein
LTRHRFNCPMVSLYKFSIFLKFDVLLLEELRVFFNPLERRRFYFQGNMPIFSRPMFCRE